MRRKRHVEHQRQNHPHNRCQQWHRRSHRASAGAPGRPGRTGCATGGTSAGTRRTDQPGGRYGTVPQAGRHQPRGHPGLRRLRLPAVRPGRRDHQQCWRDAAVPPGRPQAGRMEPDDRREHPRRAARHRRRAAADAAPGRRPVHQHRLHRRLCRESDRGRLLRDQVCGTGDLRRPAPGSGRRHSRHSDFPRRDRIGAGREHYRGRRKGCHGRLPPCRHSGRGHRPRDRLCRRAAGRCRRQ